MPSVLKSKGECLLKAPQNFEFQGSKFLGTVDRWAAGAGSFLGQVGVSWLSLTPCGRQKFTLLSEVSLSQDFMK